MRIEIENPPVEFVMAGETKATFDFFELEQKCSNAFKEEKNDPSKNATASIREWMISKGLPETINEAAVSSWLTKYMLAVEEEVKKTIGPLN